VKKGCRCNLQPSLGSFRNKVAETVFARTRQKGEAFKRKERPGRGLSSSGVEKGGGEEREEELGGDSRPPLQEKDRGGKKNWAEKINCGEIRAAKS